ncbi:MAG: tetratricopeptide repeat protein [Deltaproteobacteria bacterium]|nr:tetratricopeptide repeat protein [Deltaproteobacteria bacterium]
MISTKQRKTPVRLLQRVAAVIIVLAVYGCAPQPLYRRPLTPATAKPRSLPAPKPAPSSPPSSAASESPRRPLLEEANIREQDLKTQEKATPPITTSKETSLPPSVIPETFIPSTPPPLADDSSLLAKIAPGTPPQRAASLRLSEEGRMLLGSGDYAKALNRLERAIAIDSTNAYGHFLLAKAQYGLKRYKESLNFLEVAESRLRGEPFWLAEVYALRGENLRALGMADRAEDSYTKALSINSGNRTASEALSRMQSDGSATQR